MRIVYFGTPEFAVPPLEALIRSSHDVAAVVAQPDRRSGRGLALQPPPVAIAAVKHGCRLGQPANIRIDEFHQWLREIDPDVAVVVAYGRILPDSLLTVPRHGFINVHASLLPAWRGAAPIQRSIENGDSVTGVSIMQIDRELDHGPVFGTREVPIGPDERSPALFEKLSATGASLLMEVLAEIERGTARSVDQNHDLATYAKKIEKGEGRVDWNLPASVIYNRFRAFWPWPGLFTEIDGDRIKLIEIESSPLPGQPGRILSLDDGVTVGAAEGSIRLREVQRAGKRPVAAVELVRSMSLGIGDTLG